MIFMFLLKNLTTFYRTPGARDKTQRRKRIAGAALGIAGAGIGGYLGIKYLRNKRIKNGLNKSIENLKSNTQVIEKKNNRQLSSIPTRVLTSAEILAQKKAANSASIKNRRNILQKTGALEAIQKDRKTRVLYKKETDLKKKKYINSQKIQERKNKLQQSGVLDELTQMRNKNRQIKSQKSELDTYLKNPNKKKRLGVVSGEGNNVGVDGTKWRWKEASNTKVRRALGQSIHNERQKMNNLRQSTKDKISNMRSRGEYKKFYKLSMFRRY